MSSFCSLTAVETSLPSPLHQCRAKDKAWVRLSSSLSTRLSKEGHVPIPPFPQSQSAFQWLGHPSATIKTSRLLLPSEFAPRSLPNTQAQSCLSSLLHTGTQILMIITYEHPFRLLKAFELDGRIASRSYQDLCHTPGCIYFPACIWL